MLDDLHVLYETQRVQIRDELLRRAALPRWISIRKHVYELEELISLEGATDNRDFRELDLDATPPGIFRKFVANVTERRLRQSEALQQYSLYDFKEHLKGAEVSVERPRAEKALRDIASRLETLTGGAEQLTLTVSEDDRIPLEEVLNWERQLIFVERKANKSQRILFPELEPSEPPDAKTEEAARLFLARRLRLPYYFSYDTLLDLANGNVEQFLSVAAVLADKMIFRAELGRTPTLTASDQHDLLRRRANLYYDDIEQGYEHGYAIRQLVDNLTLFFGAVTYRPNAPIAPGVTGFGLPRDELRNALNSKNTKTDIKLLREVLTSAVAGNVIFVRLTKQGQAGAEKLVFYLNRLLCVRFDLPLNLGGWQRIPLESLTRMMKEPVRAQDWGKKWLTQSFWFDEG